MTGSVRKEGGEVERMRSEDGSSQKKKKKTRGLGAATSSFFDENVFEYLPPFRPCFFSYHSPPFPHLTTP